MRVCILNPYPFPEGMAATTRMVAYTKGMVQNGVDVDVVCFFPKDDVDPNPSDGEINGVRYSYINVRDKKRCKILRYLIERPIYVIKTLRYVSNNNIGDNRYDAVLMSFDDPVWLLIFSLPLKFMGLKTFFIGDEYPKPIRQMKSKVPAYQILLYKLAYLFIDGRIVMTAALESFYNKSICPKPTHLLNSILDTDRFQYTDKNNDGCQYLCYMGNMMLAKDNVDNIIRAFAIIAGKYPELELRLYGTPSVQDEATIRAVIHDCKLEYRVKIMGRIPYKNVPGILSGAKILVTSQPKTKRAEGGFPTKMGEYMMSHVPMIVTDVGEISKYVKDNYTAFIVEPSNPRKYAEKISYILDNPKIAADVANRAFAEASMSYCASSVVRPLITFLKINC